MAERRATVVRCEDDRVWLRADGACSDCAGCGGRCSLFREDTGGTIAMARADFADAPEPGTAVTLVLPDGWLRATAWRAYGLITVALLVGGGLGHLLGVVLSVPSDLTAVAGALLGASAALPARGAMAPEPSVRAVAARSSSHST